MPYSLVTGIPDPNSIKNVNSYGSMLIVSGLVVFLFSAAGVMLVFYGATSKPKNKLPPEKELSKKKAREKEIDRMYAAAKRKR
jgi:flagellar basal body-associated protein FliL